MIAPKVRFTNILITYFRMTKETVPLNLIVSQDKKYEDNFGDHMTNLVNSAYPNVSIGERDLQSIITLDKSSSADVSIDNLRTINGKNRDVSFHNIDRISV